MESFWMMMLPFAEVLERLPVPKLRRARMARARLDAIIYRMIADRRASGRDHGDLLSMLLAAQDEEENLEGARNSALGARSSELGARPPSTQHPAPST
jgi:cytochrome P450